MQAGSECKLVSSLNWLEYSSKSARNFLRRTEEKELEKGRFDLLIRGLIGGDINEEVVVFRTCNQVENTIRFMSQMSEL